jgi:CheY-like chemotaxis protein
MTMPIRVSPWTKRLVIVDPHLDDYRCLHNPVRKHLVQLTATTTGSNALRLVPSFADAVWLLSPQLPDMDGLDLLEMIHSLSGLLKTVVIDNQYDIQCEQRALELQAIQYICKPMQWSWLSTWQGVPATMQKPNLLQPIPSETQYSI